MSASPTGGPHRHFHDELSELKAKLLTMSGSARTPWAARVDALLRPRRHLAARVIAGDHASTPSSWRSKRSVIDLLATQQADGAGPCACGGPRPRSRTTWSASATTREHRAVRRAAVSARLIAPEPELPLEMARQARAMLPAHWTRSCAATRSWGGICRRDDSVDALHHSVFRILLTHMMEDPHIIGAPWICSS